MSGLGLQFRKLWTSVAVPVSGIASHSVQSLWCIWSCLSAQL